MRGTTFYIVACEDAMEHEVACPTLAAAREVRAGLSHPDGAIEKVTVSDMPLREMLCRVFNRQCYAATTESIEPPLLPEDSDE